MGGERPVKPMKFHKNHLRKCNPTYDIMGGGGCHHPGFHFQGNRSAGGAVKTAPYAYAENLGEGKKCKNVGLSMMSYRLLVRKAETA
jgi:hypothetical protein